MLEKLDLSDQSIINCLNTNYGIETATLTFLPIGADLNAAAYKVQTLSQTSFFLKLKQGHHHDISVEILELLHRFGIQQIIPPVKTIRGALTQVIEGFTLLVYPFVEGQDGFSRKLTDNQWIKLGKTLREIHEIEIPVSLRSKVREETYSSKWRDTVRSTYPLIEVQVSTDEVAVLLRQFMKENMLTIHRLVNRAEQLAEILKRQSPKFMLCHSDIHAGNVLIDGNDEFYIVDWDAPVMAPKERDLMFIGGGVGNVWNKPEEENLFYQGYGKIEVDLIALTYYRHERIVEDIAEYCQRLLFSTSSGENESEMYKQFKDMFKSRGVVEIAFETDKELFV